MKKTTTINFYRSKDIFISSTLYALGAKIDSQEWNANECFFCFENEPKCLEIEKKYYANELQISPKLLFDSFKTIKQMLYSR